MHLAISPVLLGAGERLFAGVDMVRLGYECTEHVSTPSTCTSSSGRSCLGRPNQAIQQTAERDGVSRVYVSAAPPLLSAVVRQRKSPMRELRHAMADCRFLPGPVPNCRPLLRACPAVPRRVVGLVGADAATGRGQRLISRRSRPFAWDRVHVFGPYTRHTDIHARLGFHWGGVERTTIEWNDGVNLVVFVRGAQVAYWFEHAPYEELGELADAKGYARDQARFMVCRAGAEQRLALVPPKR